VDDCLLSIIKEISCFSEITDGKTILEIQERIKIEKLSGLTNNNYLLTILNTPRQQFVLRVPRKSTNLYINRNNESINNKIASEIGITPKILWKDSTGISLTYYLENTQHLTHHNLKDPLIFNKVSTHLKSLQESKVSFKGELSINKIKDYLKNYFDACSHTDQKHLIESYQEANNLLGDMNINQQLVPAHVDLAPENILLQNKKIWFIDWEYSSMASPYWDIAMICNWGKLNTNEKELLLEKVFGDSKKKDLKELQKYQYIIDSISNCWIHAFSA